MFYRVQVRLSLTDRLFLGLFIFLIAPFSFLNSTLVGAIWAQNGSLEECKELYKYEKYEETKTCLIKLLAKEPQNAEANHLLGEIYLYLNDPDQAIKYAQMAVKLKNSISTYHLLLGKAYLIKLQNSNFFKQAFLAPKTKAEFQKAVDLDSMNLEAHIYLMQYCLQAPAIGGGDKAKAEEEARIIQRLNPLEGALAWADIWAVKGEIDKAKAEYKKALELDTTSTCRASYQFGYFLQKQEKYDEAVAVFEDILKKNPLEGNAYYQLGKTRLLAKKDLDKAEKNLKKCLQIKPKGNEPNWAAAHWRLGMIYELQGKRDLAISELQEAIKLEPNNKQFKETLKEIEKKK